MELALNLDVTRPVRFWPRRAQLASLAGFGALLVAALLGQWVWQSRALESAQFQLQTLRASLKTSAASDTGSDEGEQSLFSPSGSVLNPKEWPEATEALDEWVREAAQAAASDNGVILQQLTITRPDGNSTGAASPSPHVVLSVNARGTYPALKAWQAQMQAVMPSLGVESLRWQAPPNDGSGQLVAEWIWRLWVRPADAQLVFEHAEAGSGPVTWRSALKVSIKDPFGMAPPPAPPAPPVALVVEPPPMSAPVVPVVPPLQWTTIGRLRNPDGRWRLTGHWGQPNETVSLAEGDLSPAGHQVLRITTTTMELEHPETKERLSFRLPPPPRFETR